MAQQNTQVIYAQQNSLSVEGRISFVELVPAEESKSGKEYLDITIKSNTDHTGRFIVVRSFIDSERVIQDFKGGWLPQGRVLTVSGHINDISVFFTDENDVQQTRKNPIIILKGASIPIGGMGMFPKGFLDNKKEAEPVAKPTKVAKASKATKPAKAAVAADSDDDQQDIPF